MKLSRVVDAALPDLAALDASALRELKARVDAECLRRERGEPAALAAALASEDRTIAGPVSEPPSRFRSLKKPCTVSYPAPLGSETSCELCGRAILKTRRSRRFCSDLCRDTFHGRRKA